MKGALYICVLLNRKTGSDNLTVSVDAGWQKRGSGRSYNSLSGNGLFFLCYSGQAYVFIFIALLVEMKETESFLSHYQSFRLST